MELQDLADQIELEGLRRAALFPHGHGLGSGEVNVQQLRELRLILARRYDARIEALGLETHELLVEHIEAEHSYQDRKRPHTTQRSLFDPQGARP